MLGSIVETETLMLFICSDAEEEEEKRRKKGEGRRKKEEGRREGGEEKGGGRMRREVERRREEEEGRRSPSRCPRLVSGGAVPSAPRSRLRPPLTSTLGSPFPFYSNRAMDVGHRALVSSNSCCMWFSAIEPLFVDVGLRVDLFCRFLKPPRAGEVLPKFSIVTNVLPFYAGGGPGGGTSVTPIVFVNVAGLSAPRHGATAPTRHSPASLTSLAP